jgi:hypothetical protein
LLGALIDSLLSNALYHTQKSDVKIEVNRRFNLNCGLERSYRFESYPTEDPSIPWLGG